MRAALLRAASSPILRSRTTQLLLPSGCSYTTTTTISTMSTVRRLAGPTAAPPAAAAAAASTALPLRALLSARNHHQCRRLIHLSSSSLAAAATATARRATSSSSSSSNRSSFRTAAAAAASSDATPAATAPALASIRSHLTSRLPTHCCGCGVRLQQEDPDGPGFFQVPARLIELAEAVAAVTTTAAPPPPSADQQQQQVDDGDSAGASGAPALSDEERRRRAFDRAAEAWLDAQQRPTGAGAVTSPQSLAAAAVEFVSSGPAPKRVTLEGSGGGFDGTSSSTSTATSTSLDLLCARCYSLTHYGRVRSALAEAAMPAFDLARKVGRKIALQRDRRATVMVVVDITDFDGSLPRVALQALLQGPGLGASEAAAAASAARARRALVPDRATGGTSRYGGGDNDADGDDVTGPPFTLVVAANKFDLLPPQATAVRVERWVRERLGQAGLPRPERVFMTSAATGLGVRPMLEQLRNGMAFREDLWVVGAQNAGKSSLIAAMQRAGAGTGTGGGGGGDKGGPPSAPTRPPQQRSPTIAPVPGTTLGVLRVSGIPLGAKQRVFDTPGVPHDHQLTSRLPLAEAAALLPARRLKPRTWRIPAGTTILAGGLVRLDVLEAPGPTLYVTLFASDTVGCYAGKTAVAEERRRAHAGGLLVPPYGQAALEAAAMAGKGKKTSKKDKKKADKRRLSDEDDSEDEDEEEEDGERATGGEGDDDDDDDDDNADLATASSKAALVDLPELVAQDVRVEGDSWREHTVDVHVAGLGWFAFGCAGPARLRVWAPRGTAVTTHNALIPDYARVFERPGFSKGLPASGVAAGGGIALTSGGGGKKRAGGGGGRGKGGGGGRGRGGGGGGRR